MDCLNDSIDDEEDNPRASLTLQKRGDSQQIFVQRGHVTRKLNFDNQSGAMAAESGSKSARNRQKPVIDEETTSWFGYMSGFTKQANNLIMGNRTVEQDQEEEKKAPLLPVKPMTPLATSGKHSHIPQMPRTLRE